MKQPRKRASTAVLTQSQNPSAKLPLEQIQSQKPQYHKQKLHPFDFTGEDLADIKKIFPEFKPKRSATRSSNKIAGLPIIDLKKKLKEKIQLEGKQLQQLISKLDHRNEEKITWSEFLTFLENEGGRREIVNDAQLYGMGVKRLTEGEKIILKSNEDRVIEYYIDCLCYIHFKSFRLLLALFENNDAKIMELETFNVIQELHFSSDYAIPKSQNYQYSLKDQTSSGQPRSKTPNMSKQFTRSYQKSVNNSIRKMDTMKTDASFSEENGTIEEDSSPQSMPSIQIMHSGTKSSFKLQKTQLLKQNSEVHKPSRNASHLMKKAHHQNTTSLDLIGELQSNQEEEEERQYSPSFRNQKYSQIEYLAPDQDPKHIYGNASSTLRKQQQVLAKRRSKNQSSLNQNYSTADIKDSNDEPIQLISKFEHKSTDQLHPNRSLISRNQNSKMNESTAPSMRNQSVQSIQQQEAQLKRKLENQQRREILVNKQKKKMFGVLGLSQIEDQVGSTAYYLGKDMEKSRPFGLKDLFPNLYQDYDKNKKKFEQLLTSVDKQIKQNEGQQQSTMQYRSQTQIRGSDQKQTSIMSQNTKSNIAIKSKLDKSSNMNQKEESENGGSPSGQISDSQSASFNRQRKVNRQQQRSVISKGDPANDIVKQTQMQLLAKRNKVLNRVGEVKEKVLAQQEKLDELKEINKYFYKMVAPSPYQTGHEVVQQKAKRGQSQNTQGGSSTVKLDKDKGAYTNKSSTLASPSSNNCTPEMISRYVEKLNKKDIAKYQKLGLTGDKGMNRTNASSKMGQMQGEDDGHTDQNKKNKIKLTKQIYSVCANYHEILQTLVISLIDKEIKVYKVKQNGAKVSLVELFSFISRFLVTCLHIEQYVVNSRPILCLGSNTGEIAIYYIDEPVINPLTKLQENLAGGGVKVKQLLHSQFNFFTRGGNKDDSHNQISKNYNRSQMSVDAVDQNQSFQELSDYHQPLVKPTYVTSQNQNSNLPAYLQPHQMENELTCIKYMRDIGLIVTSFNGTVKIFDGFDFKEVWKNNNKNRKQLHHTNIITFDVSTALGLMATGGAEGKLLLIDPYALGIINSVQAHSQSNTNQSCEILSVQFFEESQQIFTISSDRTLAVWDAFRLEKIQLLKDIVGTHTPKYTSAGFDKANGIIFTGCQGIKMWEAKVDQKVEIKAIQVETLSKTILKERKMVDLSGKDNKDGSVKRSYATENKSGSVLVTNTSELVDIVINEKDDTKFLITVDSENLLRSWDIKSSSTAYSYKIPMKKRVTAIAVDPNFQYLAVGNCIGEVQILNLKSGGILYNLPHTESEITCLQFLQGMSEFWLVCGCWHGKVMMWTNPNEDNNFTITAKCRIGHKDDVLAIDSSQQYIVSGGVDGLVSIWNLFSGILKFAIPLPPPSSANPEQLVPSSPTIYEKEQPDFDRENLLSDNNDYDSIYKKTANFEEELPSTGQGASFFFSSPKSVKKADRSFTSPAKPLMSRIHNTNEDIGLNTTNMGSEKVVHKEKEAGGRASDKIKRSIVSLCFHPYYSNLICVLQEGGDVHICDASNGTIVHEYVAKVKINSNWACDKENQKIFVVGDVGRACLFDMSLLGSTIKNNFTQRLSAQFSINLQQQNGAQTQAAFGGGLTTSSGFGMAANGVMNTTGMSNFGSMVNNINAGAGGVKKPVKNVKWKCVRNWFVTHKIHKMEATYVVSVKYAQNVKMYITGTSRGEVKLWSNSNCDLLGVLNQHNYDPTPMLKLISEVHKEEKQKEIQREEFKQKKKISENHKKLDSSVKSIYI